MVRKLDRYLEYGAAMLILLLCFYMLVAHWLACIWYFKIVICFSMAFYDSNFNYRYSIGNSDLINGLEYGWLYSLARISKQPYTQLVLFKEDNKTITKIELRDGPSRKTMYVTALYYTMTCMTSVGFGNIAAETDNEKIFSICMMIVAGKLLLYWKNASA